MGPTDLLKPVIERHFNGTVHFGRVTAKPGKPTTFASIPGGKNGERKPVFALPGNPASALVTFHVFVVPALRKMGGWPTAQCQLPRVRVLVCSFYKKILYALASLIRFVWQLQNEMKLDPRTEFHRVVIRVGKEELTATSTGGQRSSRVASLSGANGLVMLPPRKEHGPQKLEQGEFAEAVVIGEIQMS
jgi:gephyrin